MAANSTDLPVDPYEIDEPLIKRHGAKHHEAHFDITAMIDLVFMLNIFFLVTTVAAVAMEMDLPIIRHCIPTDPEEAVIISAVAPTPQTVLVYLGDGANSTPLEENEEQARAVQQFVGEASRAGKKIILFKAERSVKLKDVRRIAGAATKGFPDMELRMAVIEKE